MMLHLSTVLYPTTGPESCVTACPRHIAMNILTAIHRLAESNSGDVKTLKGNAGEKRLRVGDYRVRFTEEHPDSLRIHTVRNRKDAYR